MSNVIKARYTSSAQTSRVTACCSTFTAEIECLQVRSSYGMFIPRFQDKIIADVETRVSNWTGLPTVYQEDMQVRDLPAAATCELTSVQGCYSFCTV